MILRYRMMPDPKKRFDPAYWKNLPIVQILDKSILINLEALFSEEDLNKADYMISL